jgi:hypothetical protein
LKKYIFIYNLKRLDFNKIIMTTINLEIPVELNKITWLKDKQTVEIYKLFSMFWVDLGFLLSEKKYQNDYLNDIKNNDFIIDSKF